MEATLPKVDMPKKVEIKEVTSLVVTPTMLEGKMMGLGVQVFVNYELFDYLLTPKMLIGDHLFCTVQVSSDPGSMIYQFGVPGTLIAGENLIQVFDGG